MLKISARRLLAVAAVTAAAGTPWAVAQTTGSTPATAKPATSAKPAAPAKPAAKPAAAKPVAAAAAAAAVVALSPGQLDAAQRVMIGKAECEFGETVDLGPVEGKPGHFLLKHKASTYQLVPEETTTGAVRLEDKRAGIVWLQIPSKSMLMNSRIGQRVADNCTMGQQRG